MTSLIRRYLPDLDELTSGRGGHESTDEEGGNILEEMHLDSLMIL